MVLPEWHPPFSSFWSFSGFWGPKPLFLCVECKHVIFAVLVKIPCSRQGAKPSFPKTNVLTTLKKWPEKWPFWAYLTVYSWGGLKITSRNMACFHMLDLHWVHQAIAFGIATEICHKLPFARNFRSEDEIFALSFAKPFAFASDFLHNAQLAAVCLRFGG